MCVIILGINAYHGDASACLVRDGILIAAAEEERFRRIKHWAGFPSEAIRFCLAKADISIDQVDHIAINRNPAANFSRKLLFTCTKKISLSLILDRIINRGKVKDILGVLATEFGVARKYIHAKVHHIEHHLAHLGSAFLVSPFDSAVVVSVDGFGDFVSTMWGRGEGQQIVIMDKIHFPHSLGIFYLAITQYLGFPDYGDEYKVMGLAPYGQPNKLKKMQKLVKLLPDGKFELALEYFIHHSKGFKMSWASGEPIIGKVYSDLLEQLLGPSRKKDEPLDLRHWNIAASAQAMYEDALFHILNFAQDSTGLNTVALAGGCAMNSVANGKIFDRTKFKDLYVQSAAGDAGGAIGAAYIVWNEVLHQPRSYQMQHSYFGPEFSDEKIAELLKKRNSELNDETFEICHIDSQADLCKETANQISQGKVIGWFQGAMEWGPRALGNRSILGDPRRADMKDILNIKIKRRESFRPFAPSILRERVADWFETEYDVPFMLQVFQIANSKRVLIPAVTHVNGSGRLQTVTREQNLLYYQLIYSFEQITGVPILLNTSFNENEPVVCTPEEALNCFLRTKMDLLVMGNWMVLRKE